ncbi:phage tail assembly protein [Sphingomonas psychrotolerans]|uniref:Phage tail assembly protein n=1 Tax=Sphingomonas psychrotolerans TaxID=1327635 RepID=A0ABU3N130_9SPHN|nr:phage tail assembly protein [Sphingomonas psychrotolerans]MDT8758250.1 phage tail assembly protein [Sphingomonas psychrotolerans]
MTEQPAPAAADKRFETVTLATPVKRGETTIADLMLRKPTAGELRGLNLSEIVSSDVTAILTLIPRISSPPLTQPEADALEADDLTEIGGVIRGFFMTRVERETLEAMLAEHRPKS